MSKDYNLNLWNKAAIGLKAAWNCNKSIEKLFNKADNDGSGSLNKKEVKKLLDSWKLGSIFNVDDIFNDNSANGTQGVDNDGDGEITLDEVLEYAKKMGYNWSADTKLMQAMKDVKNGIGSKPSMGLNDSSAEDSTQIQTSESSQNTQITDLSALALNSNANDFNSEASQNAQSGDFKWSIRPSGPKALSNKEIAEHVDMYMNEYRYVYPEVPFAKWIDRIYTSNNGKELTEEDLSAMLEYFNANKDKYDLTPDVQN